MPLMEFAEFDRRPILVAIAGPNGAGKTTFFHAHLASAGLRFVNADVLAAELEVEPYEAARLAGALRQALFERGESFVFETVFSDPLGAYPGMASTCPPLRASLLKNQFGLGTKVRRRLVTGRVLRKVRPRFKSA